MDIIYDSPQVMISHRPGNTGSAVLSFAGVGLGSDGLPQEEFVKTLSGNQHDQFFIIDKLRSWYNATDTEITDQLLARLQGFQRVYTLGNSMGGFGALYFGRKLPNCRAAIAFGPQYSVHPEIVPGERRWRHWRSRIKEWTVPHALTGDGTLPRSYVFFGRIGRDRGHARLFLDNRPSGMALFLMRGTAHHTASFMKERGCLNAVLDAICVQEASAPAVAELLARHDIKVLRRGR